MNGDNNQVKLAEISLSFPRKQPNGMGTVTTLGFPYTT